MWLILAGPVQAASETIPGGNADSALAVIGAALIASGLTFAAQWLLRRQTKDKLISEASDEVANAAKTMLADYRRELNRAKAEILELRERIVKLETELRVANGERERLQKELSEAIERRVRAQAHIESLERRLAVLEGSVERRSARPLDE